MGYAASLTMIWVSQPCHNRVQNEAMRVRLGTVKDTHVEAMRYFLDLLSMETRHKGEKVKAYLKYYAESQEPTPRRCQRRKWA